jgi:hypothetical protein
MDQYDIHIEYLNTLTPDEVEEEWNNWRGIFRSTAAIKAGQGGSDCGCLIFVRRNSGYGATAPTPSLTERIRADTRIPKNSCNITPDHYEIFADWHRQIDRELGRV